MSIGWVVRSTGHPPRLLLLILLLLLCVPSAEAQEPTDRQITESQRRLDEIRRERSDLREEMTRIRSRVSDLSSEVSNIGQQVGVAAGLVEELEFQIAQRGEQIEANSQELEQTRVRLVEQRATLERRLRDIYKRGPMRTAQVLLTAESFSDLLNRYKYLLLVARYDRRLAEEVAELETELVERERSLRTNLAQLESIRQERTREHGQLASLQARQREALANIQVRERVTAERIAQLERDEARLGELLATLERLRREAELAAEAALMGAPTATTAPAATLGPARMGSLAWPVDGPILYRFGRATQPNGTVVRWNGVGIGARPGASVLAVEAGTVVLAGPFEGYGPTVVLSHGAGYYTLYLYLRAVSVREGEMVQPRQTLGTAGGESTSEGPHVEFQIRVPGGQAVDPLGWLQRR